MNYSFLQKIGNPGLRFSCCLNRSCDHSSAAAVGSWHAIRCLVRHPRTPRPRSLARPLRSGARMSMVEGSPGTKPQLKLGAPPGTRTPNPRIKSPLPTTPAVHTGRHTSHRASFMDAPSFTVGRNWTPAEQVKDSRFAVKAYRRLVTIVPHGKVGVCVRRTGVGPTRLTSRRATLPARSGAYASSGTTPSTGDTSAGTSNTSRRRTRKLTGT